MYDWLIGHGALICWLLALQILFHLKIRALEKDVERIKSQRNQLANMLGKQLSLNPDAWELTEGVIEIRDPQQSARGPTITVRDVRTGEVTVIDRDGQFFGGDPTKRPKTF